MRGWVDICVPGRVAGWAISGGRLAVLVDGVVVGEVTADVLREDVGVGLCCGFEFAGAGVVCGGVVEVRRVSDGATVPGGGRRVEAASGQVERVDREQVVGWAAPVGGAAVRVVVVVDGEVVGSVVANRYRGDVAALGMAGGCGFIWRFDTALDASLGHVVEVRRDDGVVLPGGVVPVLPAGSFDAGLMAEIRAAGEVAGAREREALGAFLLAEAERVRQQVADSQGGRLARDAWREAVLAGEAVPRSGPPGSRLLMIDVGLPGRAVVERLRAEGHAVSVVGTGCMEPAGTVDGAEVLGAPVYGSVEEVLRRQAGCFEVVVLGAGVAASVLPMVRRWMPRAQVRRL